MKTTLKDGQGRNRSAASNLAPLLLLGLQWLLWISWHRHFARCCLWVKFSRLIRCLRNLIGWIRSLKLKRRVFGEHSIFHFNDQQIRSAGAIPFLIRRYLTVSRQSHCFSGYARTAMMPLEEIDLSVLLGQLAKMPCRWRKCNFMEVSRSFCRGRLLLVTLACSILRVSVDYHVARRGNKISCSELYPVRRSWAKQTSSSWTKPLLIFKWQITTASDSCAPILVNCG